MTVEEKINMRELLNEAKIKNYEISGERERFFWSETRKLIKWWIGNRNREERGQ